MIGKSLGNKSHFSQKALRESAQLGLKRISARGTTLFSSDYVIAAGNELYFLR
jgi:hypothetical protein